MGWQKLVAVLFIAIPILVGAVQASYALEESHPKSVWDWYSVVICAACAFYANRYIWADR